VLSANENAPFEILQIKPLELRANENAPFEKLSPDPGQ